MRNTTAFFAALAIVLAVAQSAHAQQEPDPYRSPAENLMSGRTSSPSRTVARHPRNHATSAGAGNARRGSTNAAAPSNAAGRQAVRGRADTAYSSPAGLSPFANTQHKPYQNRYEHEVIRTEIHPEPGKTVVSWGTGFIVSGRGRPCHPGCRWVPGHYEWRERRIWVPGRWREECIPAVYEVRIIRGRRVRILVENERCERYYEAAHYEMIQEQVWVPGGTGVVAGKRRIVIRSLGGRAGPRCSTLRCLRYGCGRRPPQAAR